MLAMLYIAFWKKRNTIFTRAVSIFTGFARYTHVELVLELDGTRYWISSETAVGVRVTTDISGNPDKWDIYEIPGVGDADIRSVLDTASEMEKSDAGYDWLGIMLSQLLPLRIHRATSWFCSELCAMFLQAVEKLDTAYSPYSYSPKRLYHRLVALGVLGGKAT